MISLELLIVSQVGFKIGSQKSDTAAPRIGQTGHRKPK
jgi:hypothetical protein